ncbi:MAG: hypothetical protein SPK70_04480 [Succinivibrio dextrinosolvens]|nr:hypothetical protein [Succinivibrio dextrinosolvens]
MNIDFLTLSVFSIFFGIWILVQIKFSKDRADSNLFLLKMLSEEHQKEVDRLQQEIASLKEKILVLKGEAKSSS